LIRLPAEESLVSVVRLDADENGSDDAETGEDRSPDPGGVPDAQPDVG
jgi:DNA gyrase subunit A